MRKGNQIKHPQNKITIKALIDNIILIAILIMNKITKNRRKKERKKRVKEACKRLDKSGK